MGGNPSGPPNKTKTLATRNYDSPEDYNAAVDSLESQGYVFDHKVNAPVGGGEWIVFGGYRRSGNG